MKTIFLKPKDALTTALAATFVFFSCKLEKEQSSVMLLSAITISHDTAWISDEASNCRPGKRNNSTREVDIPNPVNDGTVDDRTCYADYFESREGPTTYGNYQIAANSNHWDKNGLQPRIERSFPRSNSKIGSYVRFKGTFRILGRQDIK